jgi:DNA-directed RNA polymerase subunit beta'
MALVLFEPFIIRRLRELGHVHTVRSAKKMIERQESIVWDILDDVTRGHTVMLNRAPTLHRLSIQAFEPKLIEGEAIRVHPLVCTAYNADFDGDQMAVHVPLSCEAQLECRLLMLATNNIFSPSSGRPITTPSQDITLGAYYLTQNPRKQLPEGEKKRMPIFGEIDEVLFARADEVIGLHDMILLRNPDFGRDTYFGIKDKKLIETTAGRVIFNQTWPSSMGFYNKSCGKKQLGDVILRCYQNAGHEATVESLDRLKQMGFAEATKAGISIGIDDMIIPEEKTKVVARAYEQIAVVEKQYRSGAITDGERYNKVIDIWTQATDEISGVMFRTLDYNLGRKEYNPLYLMVDSGARGNRTQVRQLAGLRGLMAKPSGDIIERPIIANFREGLSVLEYFISTHGARKGLADTALKTADAGYMTRKLHDVAQDVIITEQDCGTVNGIWVSAIYEGDEEIVRLSDRIYGRVACDDINDPITRKMIVEAGELIDELKALAIERIGTERVKIRSVLTCETRQGICANCYGQNLASNRIAKLGEAVGVIAAQSIGEPGTQLTMRTFHVGGTASQIFKQPQIKAKNDGVVKFADVRVVKSTEGQLIALTKNGTISVHDEEGRELESYTIVVGSVISVAEGGRVKKGQLFVQWDPYNVPILTEIGGTIEFRDIIEGVTMKKELDEATKQIGTVIIEHKEDLHPQIVIAGPDQSVLASYSIPAGAHVEVKTGQKVEPGKRLAKTPRKIVKTKDITGGLPRVAELFEARRPKDSAEIARIDGLVEDAGIARGKKRLIIRDPITNTEEEHLIPLSKHLIVFKGDVVKKGQQLTEGPVVPHEILEVCGPQELQEYLLNEVQEVYRLQGVEINDKHIEIIIRQMLKKVKITDPGDTEFLWGEQIDRLEFQEKNADMEAKGGKPAEATPVLLGITKASLETDSFISAASFQDTTRVLTEAATLGRVDNLKGFKENIIMGHLIPAGTGFRTHRGIRLVELGEPVGEAVILRSDTRQEGQETLPTKAEIAQALAG